ncbi:MAG: hypothetical protein IKY79_00435 [Bacteroidales bacterium]|nr:hypothetical protein [Bacteroidales bacterium]
MKKRLSIRIKIAPWVGLDYEMGIKGYSENGTIIYGTAKDNAKKVMVLGESHYCANKEDENYYLTKGIITDLINPDAKFEPYKNTYTKFGKSLSGAFDLWNNEAKRDLWQHVIFYNYVQKSMPGKRIAPSKEDFHQSEDAFFEVLETYSPDIVIVWGKRLYNSLPQKGKQLDDLVVIVGEKEEYIEVWSYNVNGKDVIILPIKHPSSAYETKFYNKVFKKIFDRLK